NSYFEGAHDDPINIHGTHLKAVASDAPDRLTVRFMHGQSYGFTPFFKGDKVEIMDRHSLNCITSATVKSVRKIDDYEFELTFDRVVPALKEGYPIDDIAVENVTWTPEVEIVNNYFARIPTRGILITTRGKSLIEDNTFFRMPMPSVLVSDDARGWYESGPVHDLTIRRNTFIECGSPMIAIWPEYDRFDRPIHRNIEVVDNRFIMKKEETAISMRGVEDVTVRGNVFDMPQADSGVSAESLIESKDTSGLKIYDNKVVATP
ncbi:MAG: right-handed parallel beta-helix repeat-containing protein, partial [Muribaculaceae bacterium]|nr:right-handed parallel beta-helix repeat-containing protein [Muribaculaceae bacterium]